MKIAVDFDGTLFDFLSIWLKNINKTHNLDIKKNEIVSFDYLIKNYSDYDFSEIYKENDIYSNNHDYFYNGAKDFIKELKNLDFVKEVVIMTVCDGKAKIKEQKYNFIKEHLGEFVDKIIITSKDKWNYSDDYILIDDNVENITKHCLYNKGILYTHNLEHSWNNHIAYDLLDAKQISHVGINYDEIIKNLRLI